ncbi:unnamed protein product, partial [Rotaria sp. Silwood2]
MKKIATGHNIDIKWIFLESGHGKGVADAIGAAIKRKFNEIIAFNPDNSFQKASDLVNSAKTSTDIKVYLYDTTNIENLKKTIPKLKTVKGTATFHEIL